MITALVSPPPRCVTAPADPRTCPICRSHRDFRRDGWQNYSTDHGPFPTQIFRCSKCDLGVRIFARHGPPPLAAHFRAAWYSTDAVEQALFERRAGFYEHLLDLLNADNDSQRLLDVGCGFGHFLGVARRRGYRPMGCEVDDEFAARARKRSGCPVLGGGLNAVGRFAIRFDVITFVDSFYYFDDPITVLRDCLRLLQPHGRVLIRATNRNHLARLQRWTSRLLGGGDRELPVWTTDDAICCHSRRSLAIALEAAGLEIEYLSGIEPGKRNIPGLRSALLSAAQAIERASGGKISVSSGITVIARVRAGIRAESVSGDAGAAVSSQRASA